MLPNF
jgi:hypothetical protein